jgi:hypothetical protein
LRCSLDFLLLLYQDKRRVTIVSRQKWKDRRQGKRRENKMLLKILFPQIALISADKKE